MEENNDKTIGYSLPYIVRQKLGVTRYRMAALLKRTPAGYTGMERESKKYSLRDISRLRSMGKYSWEDFGALIDDLVGEADE